MTLGTSRNLPTLVFDLGRMVEAMNALHPGVLRSI